MMNLDKAMFHHANIGAALKAGNPHQAMHHTGHLMLALRGIGGGLPKGGPARPALPSLGPSLPKPVGVAGLRGRLAGLGKSLTGGGGQNG